MKLLQTDAYCLINRQKFIFALTKNRKNAFYFILFKILQFKDIGLKFKLKDKQFKF